LGCYKLPSKESIVTALEQKHTITQIEKVLYTAKAHTTHTGGYTPEEATRVAGTLLPDILWYYPKRPAAYPDNGRRLSDDVMDGFISILSNGKVTRDNVGPHTDLLASFPYLGAPHKARSSQLAAA
jgi:hypothetical protein